MRTRVMLGGVALLALSSGPACAEAPIGPVAPAIANAVADAIGVRIRDLPITAEKVYRALRESEAGKSGS